jgi:putative transcriptional regulator
MRNELRRLREETSLTQKELGERVGVSRQAVNALETGKHSPSLDLAYRIAALFGCEVEAIFSNPYRQHAETEPNRPKS